LVTNWKTTTVLVSYNSVRKSKSRNNSVRVGFTP